MKVNRRTLLGSLVVGAAALPFVGIRLFGGTSTSSAARPRGEINLTDAEWRRRLSPQAYKVLRQSGTELPFSSPLNEEHRRGTFSCAGCDLPLYASHTKYDSGTGWPSFWDHLPNGVRLSTDYELGCPSSEHLAQFAA